MIFTVNQLDHFRLRAGWMAGELSIREGLKYTKDQQAGWIAAQLQEACAMGYAIAKDEVCSTPWEYLTTLAATGPQANSESERAMNALSDAGWDLYMTVADRLIWRRRRAVREIVAAKKEPE